MSHLSPCLARCSPVRSLAVPDLIIRPEVLSEPDHSASSVQRLRAKRRRMVALLKTDERVEIDQMSYQPEDGTKDLT